MTKEEFTKSYEAANVAINASGHECRVARSIIDGASFTAADVDQPALKDASDELSKIIVRINKVAESFRSACVKGSK